MAKAKHNNCFKMTDLGTREARQHDTYVVDEIEVEKGLKFLRARRQNQTRFDYYVGRGMINVDQYLAGIQYFHAWHKGYFDLLKPATTNYEKIQVDGSRGVSKEEMFDHRDNFHNIASYLTKKQRDIMEDICNGCTYKEIERVRNINVSKVKENIIEILELLAVKLRIKR